MFTTIFLIIGGRATRAALAFYRDLLGATVGYEFPTDGEPGWTCRCPRGPPGHRP